MPPKINMSGRMFGRLTVMPLEAVSIKEMLFYWCGCRCGTIKLIGGMALRRGHTNSCGCYQKECAKKAGHNVGKRDHSTHNKSNTKVYQAWLNLRARCKRAKNYVDRGIKYDPKWEIFDNFYQDMGEPPSSKHSLGRINNDAGYSRANCRWETSRQQALNTRQNRRINFNGQNLTVTEWSIKLGGPKNLVLSRLRYGWLEHEAVSLPLHSSPTQRKI